VLVPDNETPHVLWSNQAMKKVTDEQHVEIDQRVTRIRLIPLREVLRMTARSRSSTYAGIAEGSFPKPVKITATAVRWIESEVIEWIESRIKLRR
jgi:prophage regulatory protein